MDLAISIAARIAYALLSILLLLLFVEAILSWIESMRTHPIYEFLQRLTEPFVAPMRALLRKFEFFRNLPFDFSHLFTTVVVIALQSFVAAFL